MPIIRYIQRVIMGIILFIPFFVTFVPFFKWLDYVFEDNEDDYVAPSIIASYWQLFKR